MTTVQEKLLLNNQNQSDYHSTLQTSTSGIEEGGGIQETESHYAVLVSNLHKSYGSGRNKLKVLDNLRMKVTAGAIYGLLGPSGCGKTTLLRCIIGRLTWESGDILTLGKKPGTVGHSVPGVSIGYMPQELALYQDFTIGETLNYFGRLHRMSSSRVAERTHFLLDFLNLPEKTRVIRQLSGGQQRRTSFAIALLQEPELLILDEPTVGVDPLLRQRIWEHLLTIAQSSNITIIITTHYVEEARQAHMVGLMRNGRLLAEEPPMELIEKHSLPTLEDVFLQLCERDQIGDIEQNDGSLKEISEVEIKSDVDDETGMIDDDHSRLIAKQDSVIIDNPSRCAKLCNFLPRAMNILALFIKNMTTLRRNIGFLLFEFMLPSIQIIMFCLCIGRDPYDLDVAVVNNETCHPPPFPFPIAASCAFLDHIDSHYIVQHNFGINYSDARQSVIDGKNWGVINIGSTFTPDLLKRFTNPSQVSNKTLEGSTINVALDMTNQQIALSLESQILTAFQRFAADILKNQSMNPAIASTPVAFEDPPIYGTLKPSFTNFMAPGIILSITFFMATGLTAISFVLERKEGLLDRSYVAGVSNLEVMIGHICTQSLVMLVQVSLLLTFAIAVFKVVAEGSLFLVILLTLFQGLVGMSMGLLISSLCSEETSAIQCALGSVYPNMLLSGIIWPLESMPVWLRYFSYCLPMTYAAEAMRCILARGWGLTYMPVWRGFLMSIGWGWLLMAISAAVLMLKKF